MRMKSVAFDQRMRKKRPKSMDHVTSRLIVLGTCGVSILESLWYAGEQSGVLLDALTHGFVQMGRLSLLIFDEGSALTSKQKFVS